MSPYHINEVNATNKAGNAQPKLGSCSEQTQQAARALDAALRAYWARRGEKVTVANSWHRLFEEAKKGPSKGGRLTLIQLTSALRSRLLQKELRQYGTLVTEGVSRYDLQDIWAQMPKECSLKVSSVDWQLHLWRMELGTINDGADDDTMAMENDDAVGVAPPGADDDTMASENETDVGVGQRGVDDDTNASENEKDVGVSQRGVCADDDTMAWDNEKEVGVGQSGEVGPAEQLENNEAVVSMVAEPQQSSEKGEVGPPEQLENNEHVVPKVAEPEQSPEQGVAANELSHQHGMANGISGVEEMRVELQHEPLDTMPRHFVELAPKQAVCANDANLRPVGRVPCRKIGNVYSQIVTRTSPLPRLKQSPEQTLPRPRYRTPTTPVKIKDAGTSSEVLACPTVDDAGSGLSSTVSSARRGRGLMESKTTPKRAKEPLPVRTPEKPEKPVQAPKKKQSQKSRWEKLKPVDASVQHVPLVGKQKATTKRVSSARPRKKAKLSNDILVFLNKTIEFLDIDEEHCVACEPFLHSGLLDLAAKRTPSTETQVPEPSLLEANRQAPSDETQVHFGETQVPRGLDVSMPQRT